MSEPSVTTPALREHRLLVAAVDTVHDRREHAPFLSSLGKTAGLSAEDTELAGAALADQGLIRGLSSAQSDAPLRVLEVSPAAVRQVRG